MDNIHRFIFDIPSENKITYVIKSDGQTTKIIFSKLVRLDTINLKDFPQYSEITQKKLSAQRLEISFPLPLLSSVEHLNSVILDLSSSPIQDVSRTEQSIKPLQISSLSFSWNTPVALSVFKREKYLWIVFNQYQKIDTNELLKNANNLVKDIVQLPHNSATILRLEANGDLYSEVRKEGLLWVVDLYNYPAERSVFPVRVKTDETFRNNPSLVVSLPHTEDVFSFFDPEIGDLLMAITSSEPKNAFLTGYKYPDFEFLPSSQGMAINSDDFGINIIRNASGFILQTTHHPLNISSDLDLSQQYARQKLKNNEIDLIRELKVPLIKRNFVESEEYLKEQVTLAKEETEQNNLKTS